MDKPSLEPYTRHVIFCTGERCAPETSAQVYQALKARLKELNVDQKIVRRSQTRCFGICACGPLMVVYPEGIWYYALTKEKVLRIIEEHLMQGRPVQEWIFHEHKK